jgi:phosphatidylglycerophosphatase A
LKFLSYIIATGFGVGYFPFASGTAGSAATIPLAFIAAYFGGFWAVLVLAVFIYVIGTFATSEVLKYTEHDPSIVIVDEVVGQLVTILPVAYLLAGNLELKVIWIYIAAFFLFRLFDITKPWPANYFDGKVMNAHGVMLDDVFAGIYAGAILWVLVWLF